MKRKPTKKKAAAPRKQIDPKWIGEPETVVEPPDQIRIWAESDPATQWAEDVVSGKIMSGQLMRLAAQRHLNDKNNPKLRWDKLKAADALEFFPKVLSVTAGAKVGCPFELPNFLAFVVGSLFGWYRDNGRLRFHEAWIETPKGQVKTPLSAAIGLYMVGFRGIPRAEVYSIAKDRAQANVLFADAVALCRAPIPGLGAASLESRGDLLISWHWRDELDDRALRKRLEISFASK